MVTWIQRVRLRAFWRTGADAGRRGQPGVVGTEWPRGATATCSATSFRSMSGTARLIRWNELVFPAADEVGTDHPAQRLSQYRPVVRVVIAQKRLVQAPHFEPLGNQDFFASVGYALQRVFARVVHRGGSRHG